MAPVSSTSFTAFHSSTSLPAGCADHRLGDLYEDGGPRGADREEAL